MIEPQRCNRGKSICSHLDTLGFRFSQSALQCVERFMPPNAWCRFGTLEGRVRVGGVQGWGLRFTVRGAEDVVCIFLPSMNPALHATCIITKWESLSALTIVSKPNVAEGTFQTHFTTRNHMQKPGEQNQESRYKHVQYEKY